MSSAVTTCPTRWTAVFSVSATRRARPVGTDSDTGCSLWAVARRSPPRHATAANATTTCQEEGRCIDAILTADASKPSDVTRFSRSSSCHVGPTIIRSPEVADDETPADDELFGGGI